MLLSCLAHYMPFIARTSIRSTYTIVGKSGRAYIQREVLQEREDPRLSILKAEYVVQILHSGPRMHVDSNEDENILMYPHYQNTLL